MATLRWSRSHNYETTQIFIVNLTKLDKMAVSKSLKKLVLLGYVNRIKYAIDTRAKELTFTELGSGMVEILVPLIEEIDNKFFGKISYQRFYKFPKV